jgi:hypothetical protein
MTYRTAAGCKYQYLYVAAETISSVTGTFNSGCVA